MNQQIIYPNDEGGVSILVPAPKCGMTIQKIAAKNVAQTAEELKNLLPQE